MDGVRCQSGEGLLLVRHGVHDVNADALSHVAIAFDVMRKPSKIQWWQPGLSNTTDSCGAVSMK